MRVDERPCTKPEIEDLVDTFDEVKSPRRFGGHFIDMLERTDALEWSEHAWRLTDLDVRCCLRWKQPPLRRRRRTMSEETVDLVALMNMRARTYGLLANLFREEVDADSLRELQAMRFPTATGNAKVDEGYHLLYDYLKTAWDDSVTELAIDFVRTFIGHGVNAYSAAIRTRACTPPNVA